MRATMGVKVKFFKGAWYLFIDHQGRRRAKKIGDRQTALDVARAVREKLARGDLGLMDPGQAETFEKFATRWLDAGQNGRKASTQRFYAFNLALHINPSLGARPVAKVSRADCRDLIASCRQKGLKLSSLKGVQRTLSAVLSQAVEDQILLANPAFRMGKHLRAGDQQRSAIQPLSHVETYDFLKAVSERIPEYYALFLLALRTGMRLGEILAVQWVDIDFAARFIEVRRNLVGGRVTTTKSTKRRRVDMSLKLTEALRNHQKARKAASLKAGRRLPSWVFTNADGKPLDGDNLRHRVFYALLERAKLRQIRFHDLRHTYASLLIQNGESLAYVKEQLGHSSIQVTVDVYGHLVPSANRAAVDKLDAIPTRNPDATSDENAVAAADAK
jgi:integrase